MADCHRSELPSPGTLDGQKKYERLIVIHIRGILTGRSDGIEWRGGAAGTGFVGRTGRYEQLFDDGMDGSGRFVDGTGR